MGLVGLAAWLGYEPAAQLGEQLGEAWNLIFAKSGAPEGVGGNFQNIAEHLENLTGTEVGGIPPKKSRDPRNFRHWRGKIKTFIDNSDTCPSIESQISR